MVRIRFAGCWTTITSGTYTLFFLDPVWSRRPVASIGTQAVWVVVTWVFWVAGTALLDKSSPVFTTYSCQGVVYCGQLKALFGEPEPLLDEPLVLTHVCSIIDYSNVGCKFSIAQVLMANL